MTQIKLRRDTSANFTSKNPILGVGEPAYETDTKKLKIGDGTTAYNSLDYIGENGSATDAYTKAETDELLDEKQNNLKTISPLNISNISSESVKNFSITSDSLKAYTNYTVELSASSSSISFTGGRDMVSYIDIPYKFGQVVTYPFPINSTFLSICFGKIGTDGYFEPILTFYNNNGYLATIVSDRNATWSGDAFAPCSMANSSTRRYDFSNPRNLGFAQIIFQSGSLVDIYSSFPYDLARAIFFKNEITDNEKISRIQEISVARFVTSTYVGANNTFNVSDLGLYNILNPPADGMNFSDYISGNSLYDITKNIEVNNNYLQLNIDNTLKINNNELGVNSIVTTQGNTFNGANQLVKLDSSGKLPAIDGSQLTNLPSGSLEIKSASSANFNSAELLETGLYYISGAKAPQNGPVPYAVSAMLITMKRYVESNNQNIQQTWIGCEDLVGNQIYTRYSKSNGVMNAWTRVDSNKIASASALGSIKVGDGLTISSDGTLSATGGGSAPVRYPVEVSDKSLMPSWYVVYNDGWCEQGGYYKSSSGSTRDFTFLKSFINNDYYLSCSSTYTKNASTDHQESMNEFASRTVNGFSKFIWPYLSVFYWKACGYIK